MAPLRAEFAPVGRIDHDTLSDYETTMFAPNNNSTTQWFAIAVALLLSIVVASNAQAVTIVMLTQNNGSLTSEEQARKTQFESWGHTVNTLWDSSDQAAYDAAVAAANVLYISKEISGSDASHKPRSASIGIISEEAYLDDELGFSTTNGSTQSSTNLINVVDNTHPISTVLGTGHQPIFTAAQERILLQGTVAAGFQTLAQSASTHRVLGVIEPGGALANTYNGNSTALGRRVRLPWGGDNFSFASLNSNGLAVLQNAILWASVPTGELPELVAHWKLDETSGTTAADATGNGHTGSVVGSVNWVPGIRNNSFQFDGASSVDVSGVFDEPENVSLLAWANLTAADINGAEIITLGDRLGLRFNSGGNPIAYYHNGSSLVELPFNQSFTGEGWHHFALVFDDDSDTIKLYADGLEVASAAAANSISYSGGDTRLGRRADGDTTYDFTGKLDDVRVYNYALSILEIQDVFGLLGHWYLDETSGTTAADSSPAGNDGTYSGGVTLGQSGPFAGIDAAEFEGNNGLVTIPNESHFDVTETITIAAWIKVNQFDKEWQTIIAKGDSAWRLSRLGTADTLHFAINSGYTARQVNSITGVNDGQWHHIVAVHDGESMKIYIDGVLDATTVTAQSIDTNNYAVNIAENTQATDRFWEGNLYDVRLYNRPLGQEEIDELSGGSIKHLRITKWIEVR